MSNCLQPHGIEQARIPCPSLSPRGCSNSCLLSWWWHPTISSSVAPLLLPQSFPATGSFPMSWLFVSGGQNIGDSASVPPVNIQHWFPLGLTCVISLLSKGLSRVFFKSPKVYGPTLTSVHDSWKNDSSDQMDFCQQSDVSVFYYIV